MGLHQDGEGGNKLFLNVSKGKLINKQKDISAYAYTGRITQIERVEDTFEGQPVSKIRLHMLDGEENAIITFTEESWYAVTFFARICNVPTFDKPVTIGVSASEQNDKVSFCWMKQGDLKIEKNPNFPKPEKKKTSNRPGAKEIIDWEPVLEKIDSAMKWINEKVWTGPDAEPEQQPVTSVTKEAAVNKQEPPVDDDLPF